MEKFSDTEPLLSAGTSESCPCGYDDEIPPVASRNIPDIQTTSCNDVIKRSDQPNDNCDGDARDNDEQGVAGGSLNYFVQLPRQKKQLLLLLLVAQFSADLGFELLGPFFPKEASKKGASRTEIGFIFSSFDLVYIVATLTFGSASAKLGTKFSVTAGMFFAGGATLLFGTLDRCPPGASFVGMCIACRALMAVGISAYSTAALTTACREFPERRATLLGLVETVSGAGLMLSPVVGGALFQAGGFGAPFWFAGTLYLGTDLLLIAALPRDTGPPPRDARAGRSMLTLLSSPTVWVGALTTTTALTGVTFLAPTLQGRLAGFHLSPSLLGLVFLIQPGIYGLTTPLWGHISDSRDVQEPLLILGILLCTISFLLMGPAPFLPFIPSQLWVVILSTGLLGLGAASAVVPTFKYIMVGAQHLGFEENEETFTMISSLFLTFFSMGAFLGPTLGGALTECLGFAVGASVVAGIYGLMLVFILIHYSYRSLVLRHGTLQAAPT